MASNTAASIENGEIAFRRESDFYGQGYLWTVNADGSRPRRLLRSLGVADAAWTPDGKRLAVADRCSIKIMPAGGGRLRTIVLGHLGRASLPGRYRTTCYASPDWSPDGTRVAFAGCGSPGCYSQSILFVANANGKAVRQLTQRGGWPFAADRTPVWSPDGQNILFHRIDEDLPDPPYGNWANHSWLNVLNADGSEPIQISRYGMRGGEWSPDGSRIAFVRIVWTTLPPNAVWTGSIGVMNADGSDERTLVQQDQGQGEGRSFCATGGWSVAWSPDGSKLAYSGPCPQGVYLMNLDGSGRLRLTRGRFDAVFDWRPLP